jgi:hypothetical protein
MSLTERLAEAEKQQQQLLEEMNSIDQTLSLLTPADPKRVALKEKKATITVQYRGAKQRVKEFRRRASAMGCLQEANTGTITTEFGWLRKLYPVVAECLNQHHCDSLKLSDEHADVLAGFLEYFEGLER